MSTDNNLLYAAVLEALKASGAKNIDYDDYNGIIDYEYTTPNRVALQLDFSQTPTRQQGKKMARGWPGFWPENWIEGRVMVSMFDSDGQLNPVEQYQTATTIPDRARSKSKREHDVAAFALNVVAEAKAAAAAL